MLLAFEAMKQKWQEHQEDHPDTAYIVQKGLNKLVDYQTHTDNVLAYVLAMGNINLLSLLPHWLTLEPSIYTSRKSINQTLLVQDIQATEACRC